MSKALLIAGLLGLAAATPSPWKQPKQKQCPYLKAIPVNATFDDLTALPITVPLIENEIGNYDYLFWSSFYAASSEVADTSISTTGLIGLIPQSPPNVAASEGATTNVFDTPTLYSNYTGSKTVYFDLKSFYFGCTAVTDGEVDSPEDCDVTVQGYSGVDLVATQTFYFGGDQTGSGIFTANMVLATLNGNFTKLTEVAFNYINTNGGDPPPAFAVDNVIYDVYVNATKPCPQHHHWHEEPHHHHWNS